jgi:hypothetical protein
MLWGGLSMRYKVSDKKRAAPIPISLRPKHIEMLKALEMSKKTNRSALIQALIEEAYNLYIKDIDEGN